VWSNYTSPAFKQLYWMAQQAPQVLAAAQFNTNKPSMHQPTQGSVLSVCWQQNCQPNFLQHQQYWVWPVLLQRHLQLWLAAVAQPTALHPDLQLTATPVFSRDRTTAAQQHQHQEREGGEGTLNVCVCYKYHAPDKHALPDHGC
jgi:hypothetical protein